MIVANLFVPKCILNFILGFVVSIIKYWYESQSHPLPSSGDEP